MKGFLVAGIAAAVLSAVAHATPVVFTLDSARSELQVTGIMAGAVMQAQRFGSDCTTFGGSILAELTPAGIQITGGTLTAANQNGLIEPDIEGLPGSDKANYGHWATVELGLFDVLEGNTAIRGLAFRPSSELIPISDGDASTRNFDSAQLGFNIDSGAIDYLIGDIYFGSIDLSMHTDTNGDGPATLVVADNIETLTIPVSLGFRDSLMTANDSLLMFSGTLVATREVPEPAGLGLLCLGAIGLLRRRR